MKPTIRLLALSTFLFPILGLGLTESSHRDPFASTRETLPSENRSTPEDGPEARSNYHWTYKAPIDQKYLAWRVYKENPIEAENKVRKRFEWFTKNYPSQWDYSELQTEKEKLKAQSELIEKWFEPWKTFKALFQDDTELWYFTSPKELWEQGLGSDGYVLFRGDKAISAFSWDGIIFNPSDLTQQKGANQSH